MKFLRSFLRRYFCRETVGSVTKCRLFSQASFIQATAQKSGLTFESLFIRTIKFGRCGRLQIRSGDMSLPKIQKQKSQPFMITVP